MTWQLGISTNGNTAAQGLSKVEKTLRFTTDQGQLVRSVRLPEQEVNKIIGSIASEGDYAEKISVLPAPDYDRFCIGFSGLRYYQVNDYWGSEAFSEEEAREIMDVFQAEVKEMKAADWIAVLTDNTYDSSDFEICYYVGEAGYSQLVFKISRNGTPRTFEAVLQLAWRHQDTSAVETLLENWDDMLDGDSGWFSVDIEMCGTSGADSGQVMSVNVYSDNTGDAKTLSSVKKLLEQGMYSNGIPSGSSFMRVELNIGYRIIGGASYYDDTEYLIFPLPDSWQEWE